MVSSRLCPNIATLLPQQTLSFLSHINCQATGRSKYIPLVQITLGTGYWRRILSKHLKKNISHGLWLNITFIEDFGIEKHKQTKIISNHKPWENQPFLTTNSFTTGNGLILGILLTSPKWGVHDPPDVFDPLLALLIAGRPEEVGLVVWRYSALSLT